MPRVPARNLIPSFPAPAYFSLIFLTVFLVYLSNLNPSLFRNDSPETITACVTLGLSHPPSYPLHSLMGRLFYFLRVGNPAFTLNLFSGCLSALGVCCFAANLWTLLLIISPFPAVPRPLFQLSVLAGTWMFAFSGNYWSCSLSAKGGVYILQMVLDLALVLILLRMILAGKSRGIPEGNFYFLAFVYSAGLANHWPTQTLLTPALLFIFFRMPVPFPRTGSSKVPKLLITLAAFGALALSLYLYLPLRANQYPELNFGAPNTAPRFMASVLRLSYAKVETLLSAGPSALSTLAEKTGYLSRHLLNEFHFLAWLFFAAGILTAARHKPTLFFSGIVFATAFLANLFYLQAMPIEFWHMDDHLLTLNWVFGLITAVGLFSALVRLQDFRPARGRAFLPKGLIFPLALGLPLLVFGAHYRLNDQTNQFLYQGYGLSGLKSMERNSVYFAESDYDYFSMLYLKCVEGKRNDIVLLLTPFLSRPYEYSVIQKNYPGLWTNHPQPSLQGFNEDVFFDWLGNGALGRAFYCAYANGPFVEMYLRHHGSFHFQPSGTLIQCMGTSPTPSAGDLVRPLSDFWARYLLPEISSPHPINGLFLGICSHPFTNAAYYLELRNDFSRWDWFYDRALTLIPLRDWLAETWEKKAEGNLMAGLRMEAFSAYEAAALEYLNAGQTVKSKACLQKALAIAPGDEKLRLIIKNLESAQ